MIGGALGDVFTGWTSSQCAEGRGGAHYGLVLLLFGGDVGVLIGWLVLWGRVVWCTVEVQL